VLDIVLIQEHFAKGHQTPSIINIPRGYVAFHCLSQEHAYGAAIVVKLSLAKSDRAIDRSRSNQIAAVDLHSVHGTFLFISTYLRPSIKNITDQFSTDLSCLFTNRPSSQSTNALSKVWNSKLTNSRGSESLVLSYHSVLL
jgi:exonuclease III